MSLSGIKSKPVYSPLRADGTGRYHLLVGCGEGVAALHRVLAELQVLQNDAASRTQLLCSDESAAVSHLLERCRAVLERSKMGLRLYIAGPEQFIGRVLQIALSFDLNPDEIRAEAWGTQARRVHCVHCRAATGDVHTNIVCCSGCGRWLMVRDHYSRRLAAYMGVMADAERPGERPTLREAYP